jgi:hypothetical protein
MVLGSILSVEMKVIAAIKTCYVILFLTFLTLFPTLVNKIWSLLNTSVCHISGIFLLHDKKS